MGTDIHAHRMVKELFPLDDPGIHLSFKQCAVQVISEIRYLHIIKYIPLFLIQLMPQDRAHEGYTVDNHPDCVRVDVPMWQEKTLDNYEGGFTYERWWIFEQKIVFHTVPQSLR